MQQLLACLIRINIEFIDEKLKEKIIINQIIINLIKKFLMEEKNNKNNTNTKK